MTSALVHASFTQPISHIFLYMNETFEMSFPPPSLDFGFAANVAGNRMRKTFAGTPYWMAPEIINKNTYSTKVSVAIY